jgi:hypothetical protein
MLMRSDSRRAAHAVDLLTRQVRGAAVEREQHRFLLTGLHFEQGQCQQG